MNDPGLHEPVAESQDKIEDTEKEEEDIEEEVEQSFLNPRSTAQHRPTQSLC